ncbi:MULTISPECIES: hypothetical protein [unclassified Leucobacter]|uniref:hypothetical protein n=1 Tax=unclassified Leucobacter TaxID=2621730 RepID=UPI000622261B|nr:hypothetical protein [Leucobacter sp. Ag1]KKI21015.1 hypothetical protein XM48_06415 [Leucobacter sp. Ag1]
MSDQHFPGVPDPQGGAPADPAPADAPRYAPPPQYAPPQYAPPQATVPQLAPPVPPYGPPPSAARRLPVGAWIGIGAGALVLLLVIALGVFLVAGVLGAQPRSSTAGSAPSPTPSETAPSDGGAGSGNSLDTRVDFAAGPFWSMTIDSANGWTAEIIDQQGVNRIRNERTSCVLMTYQGAGDPKASMASDRAATDDTLEAALKIGLPWTGATGSPEVEPDSTVSVPLDGGGSVEMLRLTSRYQTADGERERTILLRAFTPANSALMAQVDCPSWAARTFGDPALQGLSITER